MTARPQADFVPLRITLEPLEELELGFPETDGRRPVYTRPYPEAEWGDPKCWLRQWERLVVERAGESPV